MSERIQEAVAIVAGFSTIMFTVATIARVYLRRLELRLAARPAMSGVVEQRLERIEQAVDAIAVEMERVSEGQRFTTKLLADRAPAARAAVPGGSAPRVDTPH
jgi:hypothetical protein